jgi:hypothetical protein
MPAPEPLFCFTSNKIEVHPCANCRAPMMLVCHSGQLNFEMRTFECFNCDGVEKSSSGRSVASD